MNTYLPPLKFVPLIKTVPWGGRYLETLFGKQLPAEQPCGESWEVVDLPSDQSVVESGPFMGRTLASLVKSRGEELLGEAALLMGRFPVLFKLLDAHETLSVQVHPDEEACARLGSEARPKTEAWYILQAAPEAKLYLGLRAGAGKEDLRAALQNGSVADLLHAETVQPGDFIHLPAGTLHAIGAGIVLAEIQQSSDTTYRVFDWNRMGLDGQPRQLHVNEALESINFDITGKPAHASPQSGREGIRSAAFGFERVNLAPGSEAQLAGGRPRIVCCVEGAGSISVIGDTALPLVRGQTCLIPACRAESLRSEAGGVFLLIRV